MSLIRLANAALALAVLAVPGLAQAQSAGVAKATSAPAAAQATGKRTTDQPAATQTQGTAWAVKQAATGVAPAGGAPATPAARVAPHGDIVQTLQTSGQFGTFLKALDATNLTAVVKNSPNLTVFAPTDAAFAALPPGELDRLMADKPQLQRLLTHHLVNTRVDQSKIKGAKGPVPSVAGDPIELDGSGATLKADNADIVQPDVMASNGVVHVVDQVMQPGPGAQAQAKAQPQAQAKAAGSAGQPAASTSAPKRAGKGR